MVILTNLDAVSSSSTAQKQVVLWIGANAGGIGKTTLAIDIAYKMACYGADVAILDLDTGSSMSVFCGLDKAQESSDTMAGVLSEEFEGVWPLTTPSWGTPKGKVQICKGGLFVSQIDRELGTRSRREYILADRLQDFPLPHRLVILDCPASLGTLTDLALAVCTHFLIPVNLTHKSVSGAEDLLIWFRESCRRLRLNPLPTLLGIVPTQYKSTEAAQRNIMGELPARLAEAQIRCYPATRYTPEIRNASGFGLPLQVYRPGNPACQDVKEIIKDLCSLLNIKAR
jgi:chromosome partitioning protein